VPQQNGLLNVSEGPAAKGASLDTNLYSMAPDLFQVSGFYTAAAITL
jgi:hypothetical protein